MTLTNCSRERRGVHHAAIRKVVVSALENDKHLNS